MIWSAASGVVYAKPAAAAVSGSVDSVNVSDASNGSDNASGELPVGVEYESGSVVGSGVPSGLTGAGTSANPYQISSVSDLKNMSNYINYTESSDKHFVLTQDISLAGVSFANDIQSFDGIYALVSANATLSGNANVHFHLNGNNHTLSGLNLTVGSAASAFGLFGYINSNSTIENVNFSSNTITGSINTNAAYGMIAAYNGGTIQNCTVTNCSMDLTGGSISDYTNEEAYISGLDAGRIYKGHSLVTAENNGTISGVTVSQTNFNLGIFVKGARRYIGAIAGQNRKTITGVTVSGVRLLSWGSSDSGGTIAGSGVCAQYVGGITGFNHKKPNVTGNAGSIANSTVNLSQTSDILFGDYVGGVAGLNEGSITSVEVDGQYPADGGAPADSAANIFGYGRYGAIAGQNSGSIVSCGAYDVGFGFSGQNVNNCYGGVAGWNSGLIQYSVASGSVNANVQSSAGVGGLVGNAQAGTTLIDNYAFVRIANLPANMSNIGGLVGKNGTTVHIGSNNFWSSAVSGVSYPVPETGAGMNDLTIKTQQNIVLSVINVAAGATGTTINASGLIHSWSGSSATVTYDSSKTRSTDNANISVTSVSGGFKLTCSSSGQSGNVRYYTTVSLPSGVGISGKTLSVRVSIPVLVTLSAAENAGTSASNPIILNSYAEFKFIAQAPSASYRMGSDFSIGSDWTPVAFTGTFDGDDHTLGTYALNKTGRIFTEVSGSRDANVGDSGWETSASNLTSGYIYDLKLSASSDVSEAAFGTLNNATLINVDYDAASGAKLAAGSGVCAAIAETVNGNVLIKDCQTTIPVHITSNSASGIGAIVGTVDANVFVMDNCSSSSPITMTSNLASVGGLVGNITALASSGAITNSFASGSVSVSSGSTAAAKVVIGAVASAARNRLTVSNVYYSVHDLTIAGSAVATNPASVTTGITEFGFSQSAYDVDTGGQSGHETTITLTMPADITELQTLSASDFAISFDDAIVEVTTSPTVSGSTVTFKVNTIPSQTSEFSTGMTLTHTPSGLKVRATLRSGLRVSGGYYEIYTVADLCDIAQHYGSDSSYRSAKYKLCADLDLTGVTTTDLPRMATTSAQAFTGEFIGKEKSDGSKYMLSNLTITGTGTTSVYAPAALFGFANGATFRNIRLDHFTVTNPGLGVAVLVGAADGTMNMSSGAITPVTSSCIFEDIEITDCTVTSTRTSTSAASYTSTVSALKNVNQAGALVGALYSSGTGDVYTFDGITVKDTTVQCLLQTYSYAIGGLIGDIRTNPGIVTVGAAGNEPSIVMDNVTVKGYSLIGGVVGKAGGFPIATSSTYNSGKLYAGGFSITNAKVVNSNIESVQTANAVGGICGGIIGSEKVSLNATCANATVTGCTVENTTITSNNVVTAGTAIGSDAGGIAGQMSGIISDCTVKDCTIKSCLPAGIVGKPSRKENTVVGTLLTVSGCKVIGNTTITNNTLGAAVEGGGIIGSTRGCAAVIEFCQVGSNVKVGDIDTTDSRSIKYVGGICGVAAGSTPYTVTIEDCLVCGEVDILESTNASAAGGILGFTDKAPDLFAIRRCVFAGNVNDNGYYTGGIVGHLSTNAASTTDIIVDCTVSGFINQAEGITANPKTTCKIIGAFIKTKSNWLTAPGTYIHGNIISSYPQTCKIYGPVTSATDTNLEDYTNTMASTKSSYTDVNKPNADKDKYLHNETTNFVINGNTAPNNSATIEIRNEADAYIGSGNRLLLDTTTDQTLKCYNGFMSTANGVLEVTSASVATELDENDVPYQVGYDVNVHALMDSSSVGVTAKYQLLSGTDSQTGDDLFFTDPETGDILTIAVQVPVTCEYIRLEPLDGEGVDGDPFLIHNKQELNSVRFRDLSAYYAVVADIIFDAEDFAVGGDYYNNGNLFVPIGYDLTTDTVPSGSEFTGHFTTYYDGTLYAIVGLQSAGATSAGLFGKAVGATFEDVYLEDWVVSGSSAGLLAGSASSSTTSPAKKTTFDNIQIHSSTISGSDYAGAIAAYATDISATDIVLEDVEVNSARYCGGLFGHAHCSSNLTTNTISGVSIENLTVTAKNPDNNNPGASYPTAGGVAAQFSGAIDDVTIAGSGSISGAIAAGAVGKVDETGYGLCTIDDFHIDGTGDNQAGYSITSAVESSEYAAAGGIVGKIRTSTGENGAVNITINLSISDCSVGSGVSVDAQCYAGGVIGNSLLSKGTISIDNTKSFASVRAATTNLASGSAGAIAGHIYDLTHFTMDLCVAGGSVKAVESAGGVIGIADGISVASSSSIIEDTVVSCSLELLGSSGTAKTGIVIATVTTTTVPTSYSGLFNRIYYSSFQLEDVSLTGTTAINTAYAADALIDVQTNLYYINSILGPANEHTKTLPLQTSTPEDPNPLELDPADFELFVTYTEVADPQNFSGDMLLVIADDDSSTYAVDTIILTSATVRAEDGYVPAVGDYVTLKYDASGDYTSFTAYDSVAFELSDVVPRSNDDTHLFYYDESDNSITMDQVGSGWAVFVYDNGIEVSFDIEASNQKGKGTLSDPYVIETVADLMNIIRKPAFHYVLGQDINFNSTDPENIVLIYEYLDDPTNFTGDKYLIIADNEDPELYPNDQTITLTEATEYCSATVPAGAEEDYPDGYVPATGDYVRKLSWQEIMWSSANGFSSINFTGSLSGTYYPYSVDSTTGEITYDKTQPRNVRHKISNLTINCTDTSVNYVGFFGTLPAGAAVMNIDFENVKVTGSSTAPASGVGAIAGLCRGAIYDAAIIGTASAVTGERHVGGIVGVALTSGTANGCYTTLDSNNTVVQGTNAIRDCSVQNATITADHCAGGIVGGGAGVTGCSVSGSTITANEIMGGILGGNRTIGSSAEITSDDDKPIASATVISDCEVTDTTITSRPVSARTNWAAGSNACAGGIMGEAETGTGSGGGVDEYRDVTITDCYVGVSSAWVDLHPTDAFETTSVTVTALGDPGSSASYQNNFAGGVVGYIDRFYDVGAFSGNCVSANITTQGTSRSATNSKSAAGGLIGSTNQNYKTTGFYIIDNRMNGNISSCFYAGGICGNLNLNTSGATGVKRASGAEFIIGNVVTSTFTALRSVTASAASTNSKDWPVNFIMGAFFGNSVGYNQMINYNASTAPASNVIARNFYSSSSIACGESIKDAMSNVTEDGSSYSNVNILYPFGTNSASSIQSGGYPKDNLGFYDVAKDKYGASSFMVRNVESETDSTHPDPISERYRANVYGYPYGGQTSFEKPIRFIYADVFGSTGSNHADLALYANTSDTALPTVSLYDAKVLYLRSVSVATSACYSSTLGSSSTIEDMMYSQVASDYSGDKWQIVANSTANPSATEIRLEEVTAQCVSSYSPVVGDYVTKQTNASGAIKRAVSNFSITNVSQIADDLLIADLGYGLRVSLSIAAAENGKVADGGRDTPYIINSAEKFAQYYVEWAAQNNYLQKYYKQTVDLYFDDNPTDATDTILAKIAAKDRVFAPIGTVDTKFSGGYDGGGHTIKNFHYTVPAGAEIHYVGLFGFVDDTGRMSDDLTYPCLQNLHIELSDAGVVGRRANDSGLLGGQPCVGGLIGKYTSVRPVTNCSVVYGTVKYASILTASDISNNDQTGTEKYDVNVGGLIGYMNAPGTLDGCFTSTEVRAYENYDAVNSEGWTWYAAGGIVGACSGGSTLTFNRCFTSSDVVGPMYVSGLIGKTRGNIAAQDCAVTSTVTALQSLPKTTSDKPGEYPSLAIGHQFNMTLTYTVSSYVTANNVYVAGLNATAFNTKTTGGIYKYPVLFGNGPLNASSSNVYYDADAIGRVSVPDGSSTNLNVMLMNGDLYAATVSGASQKDTSTNTYFLCSSTSELTSSSFNGFGSSNAWQSSGTDDLYPVLDMYDNYSDAFAALSALPVHTDSRELDDRDIDWADALQSGQRLYTGVTYPTAIAKSISFGGSSSSISIRSSTYSGANDGAYPSNYDLSLIGNGSDRSTDFKTDFLFDTTTQPSDYLLLRNSYLDYPTSGASGISVINLVPRDQRTPKVTVTTSIGSVSDMHRDIRIPLRGENYTVYVATERQLRAIMASQQGTESTKYNVAYNQGSGSNNNALQKNIRICADIKLNPLEPFTPIDGYKGGRGTSSEPAFGFDGSNCVISDMVISASGTDYVGMFKTLADGDCPRIQNVILKNVTVSGQDYVGALVGAVQEGLTENDVFINNCMVITEATGAHSYGVTGRDYVGGLVGSFTSGYIGYSSTNSGIAQTANQATGAKVNVTGRNFVGGMAGYLKKVKIANCFATGNVTMNAAASMNQNIAIGGFAGYAEGGTADHNIKYAFASGDVTANANTIATAGATANLFGVGGFIGVAKLAVDNCFSSGDVTSSAATYANDSTTYHGVGGLVGYTTAGVTNSYSCSVVTYGNSGNIPADTIRVGVGGVVGYTTDLAQYCYSSGSVSSSKLQEGAYVSSDQSATGALRVVADNATLSAGQIHLSDVTPVRGNYSPAVNDYVVWAVTNSTVFVGGVVGYSANVSTQIYFDKWTNNIVGLTADGSGGSGREDSTADVTTSSYNRGSYTTEEFCLGVPITAGNLPSATWGSAFNLNSNTYPYLKQFTRSDVSDYVRYPAVLSLAAVRPNDRDDDAHAGKGYTMALTMPSSVSMEYVDIGSDSSDTSDDTTYKRTYYLKWTAGADQGGSGDAGGLIQYGMNTYAPIRTKNTNQFLRMKAYVYSYNECASNETIPEVPQGTDPANFGTYKGFFQKTAAGTAGALLVVKDSTPDNWHVSVAAGTQGALTVVNDEAELGDNEIHLADVVPSLGYTPAVNDTVLLQASSDSGVIKLSDVKKRTKNTYSPRVGDHVIASVGFRDYGERRITKLYKMMLGTADYPYLISTRYDLEHIGFSVSGGTISFTQVNEAIDSAQNTGFYGQWYSPIQPDGTNIPGKVYFKLISNVDMTKGVTINNGTATVTTDTGNFNPIPSMTGNTYASGITFQGIELDGDDYAIVNYTSNGPFITVVDSASTVKNLAFDGASITATGSDVAALIGTNNGTVDGLMLMEPQYSTFTSGGESTLGISAERGNAAGLVVQNNGTICNSVAGVAVSTQEGNYIGGIAAVNSGTIRLSVATADLTAGATTLGIGGVVGQNAAYGTVLNTISSGSVTAGSQEDGGTVYSAHAGGFVGVNIGTITNAISRAGSTGLLGKAGSFVGLNTGTITGALAAGPFTLSDALVSSSGSAFYGENSGGTLTDTIADKALLGSGSYMMYDDVAFTEDILAGAEFQSTSSAFVFGANSGYVSATAGTPGALTVVSNDTEDEDMTDTMIRQSDAAAAAAAGFSPQVGNTIIWKLLYTTCDADAAGALKVVANDTATLNRNEIRVGSVTLASGSATVGSYVKLATAIDAYPELEAFVHIPAQKLTPKDHTNYTWLKYQMLQGYSKVVTRTVDSAYAQYIDTLAPGADNVLSAAPTGCTSTVTGAGVTSSTATSGTITTTQPNVKQKIGAGSTVTDDLTYPIYYSFAYKVGAQNPNFYSGSGSASDPYIIADTNAKYSLASLAYYGKLSDVNVALGSDVSFGGDHLVAPVKLFAGTFDGAGYTINDLTIGGTITTTDNGVTTTTNDPCMSLFHKVTGTIKNLGMTGIVSTGTVDSTHTNFGLLANETDGATLTDIFVVGELKVADTTGTAAVNVGGLVGYAKNTTATGIVTSGYIRNDHDATGSSVGGVFGKMVLTETDGAISKLQNALSTAYVYGVDTIGGIVGSRSGYTVSDGDEVSTSVGTVTSVVFAGQAADTFKTTFNATGTDSAQISHIVGTGTTSGDSDFRYDKQMAVFVENSANPTSSAYLTNKSDYYTSPMTLTSVTQREAFKAGLNFARARIRVSNAGSAGTINSYDGISVTSPVNLSADTVALTENRTRFGDNDSFMATMTASSLSPNGGDTTGFTGIQAALNRTANSGSSYEGAVNAIYRYMEVKIVRIVQIEYVVTAANGTPYASNASKLLGVLIRPDEADATFSSNAITNINSDADTSSGSYTVRIKNISTGADKLAVDTMLPTELKGTVTGYSYWLNGHEENPSPDGTVTINASDRDNTVPLKASGSNGTCYKKVRFTVEIGNADAGWGLRSVTGGVQ